MLKRRTTRDRGASACIFFPPKCIFQTVVPNPTLGLLHWIYLSWGACSGPFYPRSPSQRQCKTFLRRSP